MTWSKRPGQFGLTRTEETWAMPDWNFLRTSTVTLAAGFALSGSGCGLSRPSTPIYHPPAEYDLSQPREQAETLVPYLVGVNDQLVVSISPSGYELNSSTSPVRIDGVLDLDQYGEVPVAGLTIPQVEGAIKSRIEEFVQSQSKEKGTGSNEPIKVSVRLVANLSKFYYVVGAVRDEGRAPLVAPITVIDALLNAGLLSNSLPNQAYLTRPLGNGQGARVLRIDWDGIVKRGETQTNYQIMPGDRLVVPAGKSAGLMGTLFGSEPTR